MARRHRVRMAPARAARLRAQAPRRACFRPLGPAAPLRAHTHRAGLLPRAPRARALVARRGTPQHGAAARHARLGRLGLRPREAVMVAKLDNQGDVGPGVGAAANTKAGATIDAAHNPGKPVDVKSRIAAYSASNPQSYAEQHGGTTFREGDRSVTVERGTREYFEHADRTLLAWNAPLHTSAHPFGRIFAYARYAGREVLEVGCGQGGMAQLWAERGANLTAVDLNDDAIRQTRRRFELFGVTGRIQQEDANQLSFADRSFDYAYSWGV